MASNDDHARVMKAASSSICNRSVDALFLRSLITSQTNKTERLALVNMTEVYPPFDTAATAATRASNAAILSTLLALGASPSGCDAVLVAEVAHHEQELRKWQALSKGESFLLLPSSSCFFLLLLL
jgi:hypothetical protein